MEKRRPAAMDEWVILSDGESDTAAVALDGSDDTASDDSDTAASDVYNGSLSGYTARSRPLVSHFGGVDGAPPPPLFYDGPLRAVVPAAAPPAPPEFMKEVRYSYGEALSIGGDHIKQRPAASEIEAITERSKLAIDAASQEDTICEIGNAGVVICDHDVVELTADVDDGVVVTDMVDHTATAHVDDGGAAIDDVPVVEVSDAVDQTATVHVDDGATIDDVSVVEVGVFEYTADVDGGGATTDDISVVELTDVVDNTDTADVDDGSASTDDGISVAEVADVVDHMAHVDEGGATTDYMSVVEVTDVVDHTATAHVDDRSASTDDGISVVDVTDVVDHTAMSHVDDGGAAADCISVVEVPPVTTVSPAAPPPTSSEVDDEHESRSPPTPAVVAAPRATDPPPPPRFSRPPRLSCKSLYSLLDKRAVDDEHESKSVDASPTPPAVLVSPAVTFPPPPNASTSGEVDNSVLVDDEPVHVLTAAAAMKATARDSGGEDTELGGGSRCRCAESSDPLEHCGDCLRRRLVIRRLVIREKEETSTEVLNLRQELAMLQREAAVANQQLGGRDGSGRLWPQSPAAAINAAYEARNAAYEARMRAQELLATIIAAAPEAPTTQAPPADRRHGSGQSPAAINAALEARTQAPPATTNAAPEARTKVPTERRRGSEPSAADMADFAIAYLFSSSSMILYSFLLASYFY